MFDKYEKLLKRQKKICEHEEKITRKIKESKR